MARVPKLLDVSVPLAAGMPAYPGNPEFELQPVKRIATGGSSNVSRLVMGTHTGTHVDAPRHFFDEGAGVDGLPLDLLLGRSRVVDLPKRGGIGPDELAAAGLREDIRVLLKTPNSALWNGERFHQDYTYLTEAGARYLVDQGVQVIGIDYLSVEQFKKAGAPAHRALLVPRRGHHRRTEPRRSRTGHVRDVLPALARCRRRRRSRARNPEALRGGRAGRCARHGAGRRGR